MQNKNDGAAEMLGVAGVKKKILQIKWTKCIWIILKNWCAICYSNRK